MFKCLQAMMLSLLIAISSVAIADEVGYYAALDVGQTNLKQYCGGTPTFMAVNLTTYSCLSKVQSIRASLGYQFNSYLAIEAGYVNAGQATSSFAGVSTVPVCNTTCVNSVPYTGSGGDKFNELQISVIGNLPEVNRFGLFGKVGYGSWNVVSAGTVNNFGSVTPISVTSSGNSVLMAIGAKYRVSNNLFVRAQIETQRIGSVNTTGLGTAETTSLGLTYWF